jgi:hypothetical protein
MRAFQKIALLSLLTFGLCLGAHASAPEVTVPEAAVVIDTDATIVPSYTGVGVQWDPSSVVGYTDAQWTRIFRRVDVLHPAFIRCCLVPDFYCAGFDAQGAPLYHWDSEVMARLYKILDYCQSRHIEVILGEWGPSFGLNIDDPRWSRLIGDCLAHLIQDKGYTCIRLYNKQNEPQGGHDYFEKWKSSQVSLASELKKRGLNRQVTQVGPDVSGTDLFWWIDSAAAELPQTLSVYEAHWYASDDEIRDGVLEPTLRKKRRLINSRDPQGHEKPFLITEAGTNDSLAALTGDWNSGDSNTKIRDFSYGVLMSDYWVQTMRAGLGGVSAWDLDDSMHPQAKIAPTPENPKAYNLKVWGFWNSIGGQMGHPEDEHLRPWFYPWSLLCRSFPRGARVVSASGTGLPGIRAAAALISHGVMQEMSVAVVNDSDTPRTLRLVVPNALGRTALRQFDYFDTDRPTDTEGFPVGKRRVADVDLRAGLTLALPANGLVLLTTIGGSPITLTHGVNAPVTAVNVRGAEGTARVALGDNLPMEAAVVPDNGHIRWSVTAIDGMGKAVISQEGLLTPRALGRVRVTATAANGVHSSVIIAITPDRLIVDHLLDWDKTFSYTEHWTFETIHPTLFEGAPSHLKRTTDTPESLVYHAPDLVDFAVRAYYMGELANKITAYGSPDGAVWTPLTLSNDAPVTTSAGFQRTNLHSGLLPAGINYLKITLSGDPLVYSPQLSQVTLHSLPIETKH